MRICVLHQAVLVAVLHCDIAWQLLVTFDRSPVTTVVQSFRELMMNEENDQQNSASFAHPHESCSQFAYKPSPVSPNSVIR